MQKLKPCPFCNGSAEICQDSGSFFARCENSACPPAPQTPLADDADTAANDWNTRPAATVEGLETVAQAYVNEDAECEDIAWIKGFFPHQECIQLVTRSQAEAFIAAERANCRKVIEDYHTLATNASKRADDLEANNAALTARVKELEGQLNTALAHATNPAHALKTLETQLAAARKALAWYANPEIYRPHPHGIGFEDRDKSYVAKAALEGKP